MNPLLERLIQDHKHMSKVHACLEREMAALCDAERKPDIFLLLDAMDYLRTYSDGFHHPLEDRAYARMRLLIKDDVFLLEMLDHIELQHAWLRILLRRLEGHFEAIVNDQATPLALLLGDYHAYIRTAREHIDCENKHLLPALDRYLLPADVQDIMSEVGVLQDPLFGGKRRDVYDRLYESIIARRRETI